MFPKLLRSVLFTAALVIIGSFAWEDFKKTPIIPAKMTIPFAKYFYEKYVKKEGDFSKLREIGEVFSITPEFKILSALPGIEGPKYQTIYIYLGIVFVVYATLVAIPTTSTQVLGFFISISFTVAYALNLNEVRGIALNLLEWPIYANLSVSILGLLLCIL